MRSAEPEPDISSPSSKPVQWKKTIRAVFQLHRGLHGTEGELAAAVLAEFDVGWLDEVEIIPVPYIGLCDPPLAEQLASCRGAHVASISFGIRIRS